MKTWDVWSYHVGEVVVAEDGAEKHLSFKANRMWTQAGHPSLMDTWRSPLETVVERSEELWPTLLLLKITCQYSIFI